MLTAEPSLLNTQAPGGIGGRWPALHQAIHAGCLSQVPKLLSMRADILMQNREGLNALDLASKCLAEKVTEY